MAEIKLYDYTKVVEDDWGSYEEFYCIGLGELASSVVVPLIEAVPEDEEITVRINSGGGSVFDGWSIYNALVAHKGKITVKVDGLAASIASIIAIAGDKVSMAQASLLMIHKPATQVWFMGTMDADQLKREAQTLDKIQSVLTDLYKTKTGLDEAAINAMINVETWLTPNEALTLGFINSIEGKAEKSTVSENVFNNIFKNANSDTRQYANSIFNTKKINMDSKNETIAAVKESTKATNGLLAFFNKLINGEEQEPTNTTATKDDGETLYFDGELAIDTLVYTDVDMTELAPDGDHLLNDGSTVVILEGKVTEIKEVVIEEEETTDALNARILELEAENANLTASLNSANKSLNSANEVLTKFKNTKSTWKPEPKNQNFQTTEKTEAKLDLSKEARAARKTEVSNKKNK